MNALIRLRCGIPCHGSSQNFFPINLWFVGCIQPSYLTLLKTKIYIQNSNSMTKRGKEGEAKDFFS